MNEALAWVTAIGAVVTAVATIGLVVVAYRTLGGAQGQLTLLRKQAEQKRRPYVVADLVPGLHGAGSTDLVIANLGRSLARKVLIEVGPLSKRTMTAVSPVPTDGPRRSGSGNELADVDRALRALAGHVGELRR